MAEQTDQTPPQRFGVEELQQSLDKYWSSGTFSEDLYSLEPAKRLAFVEKLFPYLFSKDGKGLRPQDKGFSFAGRLRKLLDQQAGKGG